MDQLINFQKIKAFIFDVDGVLTDGGLLVTESGDLLRKMNTKDGLAIKIAIQKGYKVAIITGGSSVGVMSRLKGLGVHEIYAGIHDKLPTFEKICDDFALTSNEVIYMGDDLPDIPCIKAAGIGTCPADATWQSKNASDYISAFPGGSGAVREIIERCLSAQDNWPVF